MNLGHKQSKIKTRIRPYQPIEEARARASMALQASRWWRADAWVWEARGGWGAWGGMVACEAGVRCSAAWARELLR